MEPCAWIHESRIPTLKHIARILKSLPQIMQCITYIACKELRAIIAMHFSVINNWHIQNKKAYVSHLHGYKDIKYGIEMTSIIRPSYFCYTLLIQCLYNEQVWLTYLTYYFNQFQYMFLHVVLRWSIKHQAKPLFQLFNS